MKKPAVYLKVAIDTPLRQVFDYLPCENTSKLSLQPGCRVHVPFGARTVVGLIIAHSSHPSCPVNKLKSILHSLDPWPLFPRSLRKFIEQASHYYHHPLGEVSFCGAPKALKDAKPLMSVQRPLNQNIYPPFSKPPYPLTTEQQSMTREILIASKAFQVFVCQGITGSGKTEVYLQLMQAYLQQGHQVLILVPEIGLTGQTIDRFEQRFCRKIAVYHSQMTPKARKAQWLAVRNGQATIVIGTRSALFLPFVRLGAIVVDEEHDSAYKQQEGFRYHARDLAVLRAQIENIPIVLGSATPSFETLANCQSGKFQRFRLTQRAGKASLPQMHILDIRHKKTTGGLSAQLLGHIETQLSQGRQVLVFHNRRGFAHVIICTECGWVGRCRHCDARLTFHQKRAKLICHHCLWSMALPTLCPDCQGNELIPLGTGTERLEDTLCQRFPDVPILRIDKDTTRKKGSLEEKLGQAQSTHAQILIGTQMLAKGHHFPNISLVAIVDTDCALFSTDFRAIEKMGQLILQVAGRAGRADHLGQVYIQSYHPDSPIFKDLFTGKYEHFYPPLLKERQSCQLPPYAFLALFRAESRSETLAKGFLNQLKQHALPFIDRTVQLHGPIPAPMEKKQNRYRYHLLVHASSRGQRHRVLTHMLSTLAALKSDHRLRWSLDVDPVELF